MTQSSTPPAFSDMYELGNKLLEQKSCKEQLDFLTTTLRKWLDWDVEILWFIPENERKDRLFLKKLIKDIP